MQPRSNNGDGGGGGGGNPDLSDSSNGWNAFNGWTPFLNVQGGSDVFSQHFQGGHAAMERMTPGTSVFPDRRLGGMQQRHEFPSMAPHYTGHRMPPPPPLTSSSSASPSIGAHGQATGNTPRNSNISPTHAMHRQMPVVPPNMQPPPPGPGAPPGNARPLQYHPPQPQQQQQPMPMPIDAYPNQQMQMRPVPEAVIYNAPRPARFSNASNGQELYRPPESRHQHQPHTMGGVAAPQTIGGGMWNEPPAQMFNDRRMPPKDVVPAANTMHPLQQNMQGPPQMSASHHSPTTRQQQQQQQQLPMQGHAPALLPQQSQSEPVQQQRQHQSPAPAPAPHPAPPQQQQQQLQPQAQSGIFSLQQKVQNALDVHNAATMQRNSSPPQKQLQPQQQQFTPPPMPVQKVEPVAPQPAGERNIVPQHVDALASIADSIQIAPRQRNNNNNNQRRGGPRNGGGNFDRRGGPSNAPPEFGDLEGGDVPPPPPKPLVRDAELMKQLKSLYDKQKEQSAPKEVVEEQAAQAFSGTIDVDKCLETIENNDVTFVITDTGTGKSTQIPFHLLERNPGCRIVNAQPRRTSTINLAKRVASLRGEPVGRNVGYSVRGEHVGELAETPLMYVTNYTLLLYILWRTPEQMNLTHIIFDEFHERTSEVEIMVVLMKLLLQKYPGRFKLILCSATVELETWRDYFGECSVGEYQKAQVVYPVHDYYLEDVSKLVGLTYTPVQMDPSNSTVTSIQLHNIRLTMKTLLKVLAEIAAPKDSILLFVPGRSIVEEMVAWIRAELGNDLDPIPWYREIELSFIQEALNKEATSKKKVYVATDIAEVSLTLPDVVFIIDSGTRKKPQITAKNPTSVAFPPLELQWESQTNISQRRGRIGRVQPGFFFTMIGKEQIPFLPQVEPQICNTVLHDLVLHSLQLISSPFVLFSLCKCEPKSISVQFSLRILYDGGYIVPELDILSQVEIVSSTAVMEAVSRMNQHAAQPTTAPAITTGETNADASKPAAPPAAAAAANTAADGSKGVVAKTATPIAEAASATTPEPGVYDDLECDWQQIIVQHARSTGIALDPGARMSFVVTLKGLLVSFLPLDIECSTIIFYGLLFGLESLSILAACAVACKSPFTVPYHLNSKVERLKACKNVEQLMATKFMGHLKSDVVCFTSAILAYKKMLQEGLSDEAQEAWCTEHSISRTRAIEITNLVEQCKEQLKTVVAFFDITDVDQLTAQLKSSAEILSYICIASHIPRSTMVVNSPGEALKKHFAGFGIFSSMKCIRDLNVATACPWDRHTVCIPFSVTTAYNHLLASISSQLPTQTFNAVLLIFSFRVRYTQQQVSVTEEGLQRGGRGSTHYVFEVVHQGVPVFLATDEETALQVLHLRRILCAKMSALHCMFHERLRPDDTERLSEHIRSLGSNFGIPKSIDERPDYLSAFIATAVSTIVKRVNENPDTRAPPQGYCNPINMDIRNFQPKMQSTLVHSSNGISSDVSVPILPVVAETYHKKYTEIHVDADELAESQNTEADTVTREDTGVSVNTAGSGNPLVLLTDMREANINRLAVKSKKKNLSKEGRVE